MKGLQTKSDRSGFPVDQFSLSAAYVNSAAQELANFVESTGQTLDQGAETAADPNTEQVSRGITAAAQAAQSCVDSGVANAYVLNNKGDLLESALYIDGMILQFVPGNDNTGNSTLNYNGIGTKKVLLLDGSEIPSGTLASTSFARVQYDISADSGNGAWIIVSDGEGVTIASQAEAEAGVNNINVMTPLRTAEARGVTGQWVELVPGQAYKRPDGIIEQWGTTLLPSSTPANYSFPIAFPTGCLSFAAVLGTNSNSIVVSAVTATNFTANTGTGSNLMRWIAVGN